MKKWKDKKKKINIFLIMVLCVVIMICTIIYIKSNTNSDYMNIVPYSSFNKKIVYFDLEKFISTFSTTSQKYDYTKLAFALQGLINKQKPVLYYRYQINEFTYGGQSMDEAWLTELKKNGNYLSGYTIETYSSFYDIINLAIELGVINGVVLWDGEVPATANVASTIAGVENLVPIKYDTSAKSCYTDLVINRKLLSVKKDLNNKFRNISYLPDANLNPMKSGIASSRSSKNDAYLWAKKYYLDTQKTNSTLMAYSRDAWTTNGEYHLGINNTGINSSDYLIQNKAFFFDLSPDSSITPIDDRNQPLGTDVKTLKSLLAQQASNNNNNIFTVNGFVPWAVKYTSTSDSRSSLGDVQAEWKMIEIISSYGGESDADAISPVGLSNASFFSHIPLNSAFTQKNDKEAIKSGKVIKEVYNFNTKYFVVYMGDYDCGSWVSNVLPSRFAYSNGVTDKYPLAWPVVADLSKRVPHAYNWMYNNQRANDYFVVGDNGTGYLNPMVTNNLTTWKNHNKEMNKKFDLDITGLLIGGNNKITQTVQDAYVEMTPVSIGYQVGDTTTTKNGNTPFFMTANTTPNSSQLGQEMYNVLNSYNTKFMNVRVIQSTREEVYDAIDVVYKLAAQSGQKVKVVDPYTMAYLYNNHPTSYKGCYTNGSTYKWINGTTVPNGYSYVSTISAESNCGKSSTSIQGDTNGDGKISSQDYILIKEHILSIQVLTGDNLKRADANGDGKVSTQDYIFIRKKILGLI